MMKPTPDAPAQATGRGLNPLATSNPKHRLLNSGLLLGFVHIGLFLWGNENATPLKLIASFTVMMGLLSLLAFWRSRRLAALVSPVSPDANFPGAAP